MPDDGSIRMYSRGRGGRTRSQSTGAATGDGASSTNDISNTGQSGIAETEASQIFNKYHNEMGVSSFALRAMFRQTKFSDMKNLDKHITSAQLARVSAYRGGRRKQFEERIDLGNLGGMDDYLLDFAFTVKPIETLLEFIDVNQDDADFRTLRKFFAEEDTFEKIALPNDLRLKEILVLYQDILAKEVDLLTGANQSDKTRQIQAIAQSARECFDKLRSLKAEKESGAAVNANEDSQAESEESNAENSNSPVGPQRITKKSMENYDGRRTTR